VCVCVCVCDRERERTRIWKFYFENSMVQTSVRTP